MSKLVSLSPKTGIENHYLSKWSCKSIKRFFRICRDCGELFPEISPPASIRTQCLRGSFSISRIRESLLFIAVSNWKNPWNSNKIFLRDPKLDLAPHCQKSVSLFTPTKRFENIPSVKYIFFRFERNNKWVFSIRIFDIYGGELFFPETVKTKYLESYKFWKNRYLIGYKWSWMLSLDHG